MKNRIIMASMVFAILVLCMCLLLGNRDKVVAKVGKYKIYQSEIDKNLKDRYYEAVEDSLVNKHLIIQAYSDLKLSHSDEDLNSSLEAIQYFDNKKTDLEDEETYDYVVMYTMIRKLANEYVITNEDLEGYIDSAIEDSGELNIYTTAIYGTKEQIDKMKVLTDVDSILKYAKEQKLTGIDREVFSLSNYYEMNFSNIKENSFVYFDGNVQEEEDVYSSQPAIVIVTKVEKARESVWNIDINREKIIESYCCKNYYQVKVSLQNVLQGKYEVIK